MDTGQEVAPIILHHSALRPVCLCKLTVWAKWGFTIIYLLCRLKMVLQYGPRFSSCYIKIWLLLITVWMTSPVTLWVKMRPPITSVIFRVYSFFFLVSVRAHSKGWFIICILFILTFFFTFFFFVCAQPTLSFSLGHRPVITQWADTCWLFQQPLHFKMNLYLSAGNLLVLSPWGFYLHTHTH